MIHRQEATSLTRGSRLMRASLTPPTVPIPDAGRSHAPRSLRAARPSVIRTTMAAAGRLIDDGCGGTLDCGECQGTTRSCVRGEDGVGRCLHRGEVEGCEPKTADEACGAGVCGHVSDGCASTINCGGCGEGEHCTAGTCGANECVPPSPETLCAGKCGSVSDGCGGVLHCSEQNGGTSCSFFDYCGFGGVPNECGCTPNTTCEEAG